MSSPGYSENKRYSIPVSPTKSRESSVDPKSRSNSTARKDSITTLAKEFTDNSEKLASKHSTNKIQVIVDAIIKVLEAMKN